MSKNKISYKEQNKQLRIMLKKTLRQNSMLNKKLQQKDKNFKKLFTKDQTNFITHGTQRGAVWYPTTINKALKLYVACGQKGYKELRRQKLPYPSIRTLQYHIRSLKFKPGIFEDIIKMLKMKVSTSCE